MMTAEEMAAEARALTPIPAKAAAEYAARQDDLVSFVNRRLGEDSVARRLIGAAPLRVMHDNHRNHVAFMSTVFRLNHFELLAETVPWVYRSYHARGFSYDYFPTALRTWIEAVGLALSPANTPEIGAAYAWLIERHEAFVALSERPAVASAAASGGWEDRRRRFLAALLAADQRLCLRIADDAVDTVADLESLYLDVMQPSMYEIGDLWERGAISVAEEHLATAIVSRVMASLYPRFLSAEPSKGRAVVTSAPNEYHEIGGRMVADLLEVDGWDVAYLGANTPDDELLTLLRKTRPRILGLSVALSSNLEGARRTIELVRADESLAEVKVLVGGRAFLPDPSLSRRVGADGFAPDARVSTRTAREWWSESGD